MNIRPAVITDISFILALDRASATLAHWSEEEYVRAVRDGEIPERLVLVAESAGAGMAGSETTGSEIVGVTITGFLVARHVLNEWELENVVVAAASRRNGIGRRLLEALITAAKGHGSEAVFLEVRESNASALSLYEKLGFQQTGRRRAYYQNPSEDAILYRLDLS